MQNSQISERLALIGKIDPQSSSGALSSTLAAIGKTHRLFAIVQAGALGSSATLDAKIQIAIGSGGSPIDLPAAAITQFTKVGTDDNKVAFIAVNLDKLAHSYSAYTHAKLVITNATAANLCAGLLFAGDVDYLPASLMNMAAVDEIVSL